MARDIKSRRRRALAATFAHVIDEDSLLQELWGLQDALRSDAVGDIIELVDGLAQRHMLDGVTCKRLYTELFKNLRLPEDALPLDPLPAMQAARAALAPPPMAAPPGYPAAYGTGGMAPPPAWAGSPYGPPGAPLPPAYAMAGAAGMALPPGYPAGYAAAALPAAALPGSPGLAAPVAGPPDEPPPLDPFPPTPAADTAAATAAVMAAVPPEAVVEPEPPKVFGALMRAVLEEVQRFHAEALDEIRSDAMRLLAGSAAPAALRESFARAWERPQAADWALAGRSDDLADLVKVVHRALEMAFGRAGADQIVQRAAAAAGAVPEAQRLPPKRLLSAL